MLAKNGSRWFQPARVRTSAGGGTRLRSLRSIAHHLLQHLEIVEVALPALRGDPADGLRPVAVVALLDRDQAGLLQHLQVAGEIAVSESAHLLELAEGEAC